MWKIDFDGGSVIPFTLVASFVMHAEISIRQAMSSTDKKGRQDFPDDLVVNLGTIMISKAIGFLIHIVGYYYRSV